MRLQACDKTAVKRDARESWPSLKCPQPINLNDKLFFMDWKLSKQQVAPWGVSTLWRIKTLRQVNMVSTEQRMGLVTRPRTDDTTCCLMPSNTSNAEVRWWCHHVPFYRLSESTACWRGETSLDSMNHKWESSGLVCENTVLPLGGWIYPRLAIPHASDLCIPLVFTVERPTLLYECRWSKVLFEDTARSNSRLLPDMLLPPHLLY